MSDAVRDAARRLLDRWFGAKPWPDAGAADLRAGSVELAIWALRRALEADARCNCNNGSEPEHEQQCSSRSPAGEAMSKRTCPKCGATAAVESDLPLLACLACGWQRERQLVEVKPFSEIGPWLDGLTCKCIEPILMRQQPSDARPTRCTRCGRYRP